MKASHTIFAKVDIHHLHPLLLRYLGLPPENTQARRGCELLLAKDFYFKSWKHSETCITGWWEERVDHEIPA